MHNTSRQFGIRRMLVFSTAGVLLVASGWETPLLHGARVQASQLSHSTASDKIPDYEYDVVSVKPTDPSLTQTGTRIPLGIVYSADGFDAKSMRLWGLIINAYGVQQMRVLGAPEWWNTERFNLLAKVDPETADALQKLPPDQLKLVRQRMLQKILTERFGLTFHHETKEMPAFFMTIAKGGSKLQEYSPSHASPNDVTDFEGNRAANRFLIQGDELIGQSVTMNNFIAQLSLYLDSPVVDKTGLTGSYDFRFKFFVDYSAYAAPPGGTNAQPVLVQIDTNGPLMEAIQKNLGLKLEQGKGPVDVIVIDHSERPSGN
jgi:bla regulator protein blaR1